MNYIILVVKVLTNRVMIDFEITQDKAFLEHFWDSREIYKLSKQMVEKLRNSEDPYGKYGYGQWLYRVRPDGDNSVKEAQKCFEYADKNGVADAKQMLSYMLYYGDYFNESKGGIWEKNNALALVYNAQAQEADSELARLRQNFDLFYGNIIPTNRAQAIKDAEKRAGDPTASILWTEQLGWFYEDENRTEEAIKLYEKCIEKGLYYPILFLALIYYQRGNIAYYDSLMEEGIEKGVPGCMAWGFENENVWDELSEEQQNEIHQRLATNLYKGVELGNSICAYTLASFKMNGSMGFERDMEEALRIAYKGVEYHMAECCELITDMMISDGIEDELPAEKILSDEEYSMMVLKSARYGNVDRIDDIVFHSGEFIEMGYGDEVKFWSHKLKETQPTMTIPAPEPKTPIEPSVLVIYPNGVAKVIAADVYPMSFSEMGALINAKGVDAVHFSEPLTTITKSCKLSKNVTMYVDKEAVIRGLDDNAVGTILYGRGYEILGPIIIAMEDNRYDVYSFDTEEDINNVYDAIQELTNNLLRKI